MKFTDRSKRNPFTMEDNVWRVVYFNDWSSEYISENITQDQMQSIEEYKYEEVMN